MPGIRALGPMGVSALALAGVLAISTTAVACAAAIAPSSELARQAARPSPHFCYRHFCHQYELELPLPLVLPTTLLLPPSVTPWLKPGSGL